MPSSKPTKNNLTDIDSENKNLKELIISGLRKQLKKHNKKYDGRKLTLGDYNNE